MDLREIIAAGGSTPRMHGMEAAGMQDVGSPGFKQDDMDDDDLPPRKKSKAAGKPKNTIVWEHVQITEQESGINEQRCKYCDKTKMSKQLQTTFWTMHLVDPVKGCPNCPLEVRQELAANSRSSDVHRAASQISDQTPAMLAAKMQPPIRRRKKNETASQGRSRSYVHGNKPSIVAICGSSREGSFNKMLFDLACQQITQEQGIVTPVDLKELDLPIYDADLEKSDFPEAAKRLKADLVSADGILIVSPEYNGMCAPSVLNAITWVTRGEGRMYAGFKEKFVSIMCASPGTMGGVRMIRSMNQMLLDMGALVVPGNNAVGNAFQTFDRDGGVTDERALRKIEVTAYQLVRYARYQNNRERDSLMDDQVQRMHNMAEYGRVDW